MYGAPIEDVKVIQQVRILPNPRYPARTHSHSLIAYRVFGCQACREMFASRPYSQWEQFFETHELGKDFVWSVVATHKEILQDEQALANNYIEKIRCTFFQTHGILLALIRTV